MCRVQIDEQVNLITPYFDRESKLLYTVGKRWKNVNVFNFNEALSKRCLNFKSNNAASYFALIKRKNIDFPKNEVD